MRKSLYIAAFTLLFSCTSITLCAQKAKLPDSTEIIYMLNRMQDPDVIAGVFMVPDNETPLRKLRSGNYPEQDDNFLNVFIEHNLMKLYPVNVFKPVTDNVCFIQLPAPSGEYDRPMSFLPYPGTQWFLLMSKNIRKGDPKGWLRKVKNYERVSFINEESVFSVTSERLGNFTTSWNKKYPKPPFVTALGNPEIADLKSVYAFMNAGMNKLGQEEFEVKYEQLKDGMKSTLGKYCCNFIRKK